MGVSDDTLGRRARAASVSTPLLVLRPSTHQYIITLGVLLVRNLLASRVPGPEVPDRVHRENTFGPFLRR